MFVTLDSSHIVLLVFSAGRSAESDRVQRPSLSLLPLRLQDFRGGHGGSGHTGDHGRGGGASWTDDGDGNCGCEGKTSVLLGKVEIGSLSYRCKEFRKKAQTKPSVFASN